MRRYTLDDLSSKAPSEVPDNAEDDETLDELLKELGAGGSGWIEPEQETVICTPRGARTVSDVTFAPSAVSRPRMRTVGNGLSIFAFLLVAVWCSTPPDVGTGVAAGTAGMSNVGAGAGVGLIRV